MVIGGGTDYPGSDRVEQDISTANDQSSDPLLGTWKPRGDDGECGIDSNRAWDQLQRKNREANRARNSV